MINGVLSLPIQSSDLKNVVKAAAWTYLIIGELRGAKVANIEPGRMRSIRKEMHSEWMFEVDILIDNEEDALMVKMKLPDEFKLEITNENEIR